MSKIIIVLLITVSLNAPGQSNFNYELSLVPVSVTNLPGLHSYAYAQYEGKWLIIGGRKDGLHARQPFNAFPASQNNTNIFVVDVQNDQLWTASVDSLPTGLKEQLQSTNMNFYQDGDSLYIIGGYGFSPTANNHITYPYLTSVNVSGLMNAIQLNQPISLFFKQIQDDIFAVTGGHLKKLNKQFYLVGGHRFDGRYNPMGNPTFTQAYTNQIRIFSINNSGSQLSYNNYSAITDAVHLRRRDYNLLPQIFPNREQGLTISSGVFQINANLPFLYPVDITANGYTPITTFNQYLSNYHSPVLSMYDSIDNNMHSIFFGGMSQYYYENGNLIQDDLVPFVKTISRLSRDANGILTEYLMPIEMPGLKGSSAEFIPNLNLPHYSNKVFKTNEINQTTFLVGHIFGGITSPSLNPFSNNQTSTTSADNTIYEVWLTASPLSVNEFIIDGKNPYDLTLFPNPFNNSFSVKFNADHPVKASYFISNSQGKIVLETSNEIFNTGINIVDIEFDRKHSPGKYFITFVFDNKYFVTEKILKK
ncbi:MAG: T9SS C-terminal target domain-containing protein [Chitinophagaceae bacterium]|nr:MAG: T9SS C-terminal target domain-containing protein [Chitinophagaceae bacterium]